MDIAKGTWLALCLLALAPGLYLADGSPTSHADEVTLLVMLVLSAPLSFIVPVVYAAFAFLIRRTFSMSIAPSGVWYLLHLLVNWVALVAVGYWQWFVLVPRAVRYAREGRRGPEPESPERGDKDDRDTLRDFDDPAKQKP
jgi:hypothetical protein